MDVEDELIGGEGSKSFFSYMFSLSSNEKSTLVNTIQYVVLAIIPIMLILKLMKKYIPADNDQKASIEILIEVVIQLIIIFVAFWFIHKLILFIPTYSDSPYPSINVIQIVIPVIFILFSMNSTISEKVTILLHRTLVMVGVVKENCDEDEQKPKKQVALMPPSLMPMVSSQEATRGVPSYDMRQDQQNQQNQNTFAPQMQSQYGIQEPAAANEMCGMSMF